MVTKGKGGTTADGQKPRATEVAYQRLSGAIVTLDLAPGSLVNERELCDRLDVTRLTLVPALHRLAETGLVSILPRRGVMIAPVDVLDVQKVFDARDAIEGKIAELAALRASPSGLDVLKTLSLNIDTVGRGQRDYRAFLEHDTSLHMALADVASNRFLSDLLQRVWKVNLRLWHLFFSQRGTDQVHFLSHDEIIKAVDRRDGQAARTEMAKHIAASKDLLYSRLWGSGTSQARHM